MIKKRHLGVAVILGVSVLFLFKKDGTLDVSFSSPAPKKEVPLAAKTPERQIIDQHKKTVTRLPASVSYLNIPAKDWEEKLETKLKEQAGDSLKEIKITKERSLIWVRDANPLHVEAVRISMTNQQDVEASFRALVDSQTGKVLESYDQTIFDPADVRAEFRISLEERNAN